jgi:hypothetical protein
MSTVSALTDQKSKGRRWDAQQQQREQSLQQRQLMHLLHQEQQHSHREPPPSLSRTRIPARRHNAAPQQRARRARPKKMTRRPSLPRDEPSIGIAVDLDESLVVLTPPRPLSRGRSRRTNTTAEAPRTVSSRPSSPRRRWIPLTRAHRSELLVARRTQEEESGAPMYRSRSVAAPRQNRSRSAAAPRQNRSRSAAAPRQIPFSPVTHDDYTDDDEDDIWGRAASFDSEEDLLPSRPVASAHSNNNKATDPYFQVNLALVQACHDNPHQFNGPSHHHYQDNNGRWRTHDEQDFRDGTDAGGGSYEIRSNASSSLFGDLGEEDSTIWGDLERPVGQPTSSNHRRHAPSGDESDTYGEVRAHREGGTRDRVVQGLHYYDKKMSACQDRLWPALSSDSIGISVSPTETPQFNMEHLLSDNIFFCVGLQEAIFRDIQAWTDTWEQQESLRRQGR